MSTGKFIAYYRVSTARQGRSGLGLDAQKHAVQEYLNGGRWRIVEEVTEIESGKRNDRPQLARALSLCRLHGAKLVIAKLDRLARNVAFISNLMESGVQFEAVDLPAANSLTIHILAAVAQAESLAISARTKVALAAARRRNPGINLGGDRGNLSSDFKLGTKASAKVRGAAARKRALDLRVTIENLRAEGHTTLQALASGIDAAGVTAPRGGPWSPAQVARVLKLIEETSNAE
jgi:DNA invertase Pin-like site-specific DNA recombinase